MMPVWNKLALIVGAAAIGAVNTVAQNPRISPHDIVSERFAATTIHITYGRPFLRGRQFVGDIVKFGQMWRTGADEATVLITDAPITIGSANVPPGRYSLFTIPGKDKWTLVINKEPDLFGRVGYNRKRDLARVDMELNDTAEHMEQFTIRINKKSELDGLLEMALGNVLVNVGVATKPPVTTPRLP